MAIETIYRLTLHKTYYDKGFFNLGVDVDQFVRPGNGPIKIRLGSSPAEIVGSVNRDANQNGTPRIMGGVAVSRWFQNNCELMEVVEVVVVAPGELHIRKRN